MDKKIPGKKGGGPKRGDPPSAKKDSAPAGDNKTSGDSKPAKTESKSESKVAKTTTAKT